MLFVDLSSPCPTQFRSAWGGLFSASTASQYAKATADLLYLSLVRETAMSMMYATIMTEAQQTVF